MSLTNYEKTLNALHDTFGGDKLKVKPLIIAYTMEGSGSRCDKCGVKMRLVGDLHYRHQEEDMVERCTNGFCENGEETLIKLAKKGDL